MKKKKMRKWKGYLELITTNDKFTAFGAITSDPGNHFKWETENEKYEINWIKFLICSHIILQFYKYCNLEC